MPNGHYAIAIDGPAAAGKTTAAKLIAEQLTGFTYCDTGALYRALAVGVKNAGVTDVNQSCFAGKVESVLPQLEVSFRMSLSGQRALLNGEDVTDQIRTEEISRLASAVSAIPTVRIRLNDLQRDLAGRQNVVMEGRDIGTVILPEADTKIFLTAAVSERTKRRCNDLLKKGMDADYESVRQDLLARDAQDMNRKVAPLTPAKDAICLDNTLLTIEETVSMILAIHRRNVGLMCKRLQKERRVEMYFIVRTKTAMILSNDLIWLQIGTLKKEDSNNLLSVNTIATAQTLCRWFVTGTQTTSPLTPKTIKTKWGIDLSSADKNSFAKGLQSKRYPDCLKRVPVDKNQITAFQSEWVKEEPANGLVQAAIASAPAQKESHSISVQESGDTPVIIPPQVSAPTPAAPAQKTPAQKPAQKLNLTASAPVKQKSALINEVASTFSAFGQLAQQVPEMLKERQNELATVEKKLLDLRHIAELHADLNAAEGYRFYREQRDALRRRRTLKEEVEVLGIAANLFVGVIDPAKIHSLTTVIDNLDNRKYRPRAILESEVAEIIHNPKTLDYILDR